MALDPNRWTLKTQEALQEASRLAEAAHNAEVLPAHFLTAALGQDGGPVTSQDLKIQSPYNTYLNKGLPPTPICMPSADAMDAALHPPPGAWLYFVLVNKNGTMAFSDTYTEQQANEQLAKSRGLP